MLLLPTRTSVKIGDVLVARAVMMMTTAAAAAAAAVLVVVFLSERDCRE